MNTFQSFKEFKDFLHLIVDFTIHQKAY